MESIMMAPEKSPFGKCFSVALPDSTVMLTGVITLFVMMMINFPLMMINLKLVMINLNAVIHLDEVTIDL